MRRRVSSGFIGARCGRRCDEILNDSGGVELQFPFVHEDRGSALQWSSASRVADALGYTQLRDRETIVDKRYQRDVWKPAGDPGTVLVDGEISGIWRPRKNGRNLTITIKTFGSLRDRDKKPLQAEAEQVASLRGASSVGVLFDAY